MKRRVLLLLVAGVCVSAGRAYSHHSFAGYFPDKTVTIQGELVQFLFRNPHSFVEAMAPDENGQMQRWVVEWGSIGQLGSGGVSRETLKAGDRVIITGNPSRNPAEHRLRLVTIARPADGWNWDSPYPG